MDVLGAHARISGGRYLVGFALLHDHTLVDTWSLPSPAGDDGARLAELHRFASDLLGKHSVDAVSVKGSEAGTNKALVEAGHAQGAVLSAAGVRQIKTKVWTGSGYRAAIGAQNNAQVLTRTEGAISGNWPSAPECRQAVAAALAAIRRPF